MDHVEKYVCSELYGSEVREELSADEAEKNKVAARAISGLIVLW